MLTHLIVASVAFATVGTLALAQQTGTVIGRKPGSAVGAQITSTKVIRKPSCDSPALTARDASDGPAIPEMVFSRDTGDLVCVRHANGLTEELHSEAPGGLPSSDGTEVAYWIQQKHELHVFSIPKHADILVDTLAAASMRGMVWSAKGHALSYFPMQATPPGLRAIDLDSGRRQTIAGSFVTLVRSPDPEHVVAVAGDGVERFTMGNGQREVVAKLKYVASAEYSKSGVLLGILANLPAADANAPQVAETAPDSSADDDTPDCTGGAFFLIVQDTRTGRLMDVPYPKGFDTVEDFAFSPDDRSVAVTFAVVGCDYPGEKARIYVLSLPQLTLSPISPEDRLSVKPQWTPDGKVLVYSDYQGSDSPLVAFDLQAHKIKRLTNPGQFFGPDTWLGWR